MAWIEIQRKGSNVLIQYDSSKESAPTVVDTYVPPVVVPPPVTDPWPRIAPDVIDLDLVNYQSVMDGKFLDGNPGWDGTGRFIHYGDMAGPMPATPPPGQQADWAGKFSNATVRPQFLVENGLHFLRVGTDGAQEALTWYPGKSVCGACRMIFWDFHRLTPRPEYYFRYMVRVAPETLANQTDLGIKLAGLGGGQPNYSEVLELGQKTATGWPLQLYSYDAEGNQNVEDFGVSVVPGRWYTFEQRVAANTTTNGVYNKDGTVVVKIDGVPVWYRNDVLMFNSQPNLISRLLVQCYHGGTRPPSGRLTFDIARIAVSTKGWIGPAIEVAP